MPSDQIPLVTSIAIDTLLIFYGFGIAFLGFAIQIKFTFLTNKEHISEDGIGRCSGIYQFVKTICNWAVVYFLSGLLLLIASMMSPNSETLRPLFINMSFFSGMLVTIVLLGAYIFYILVEMIRVRITAAKYGI